MTSTTEIPIAGWHKSDPLVERVVDGLRVPVAERNLSGLHDLVQRGAAFKTPAKRRPQGMLPLAKLYWLIAKVTGRDSLKRRREMNLWVRKTRRDSCGPRPARPQRPRRH